MKPARIHNNDFCFLYRQKIGQIRQLIFRDWFESKRQIKVTMFNPGNLAELRNNKVVKI